MAKATLISREQNIAHLTVELDAAEVDKHFRAVYRDLANRLNVPGFRKGKIPANVIKTRVGAETLSAAAAESLKEYAVDEALRELKLTIRRGDVTWHSEPEPQEETALTYEVSLPVLPEIKLPDYREYDISIPQIAVTEDMKQRYRERLAENYTAFPPKDGPVAEQDCLTVSFTSAFADSGEETPFKYEGLMYELGREGNLPGWDATMAGHSAGDSFEFDYDVPENFADARVAGKLLRVKVSVQSVHDKQVPAIDETFVKDQLHMESMAQFNEYLEASLGHEIGHQAEENKREQAMQRIVEELEAELTDDMVAAETDGMVKENDQTLRRYNSSLDQYLKDKNQTLQEYRAGLYEAAARRIRFYLAVREIANQQEINATPEDFKRYTAYLMQRENITPEQMKQLLDDPDFISEVVYRIIREKVLEHVVSCVQFTEQELPEEGVPATE